MGLFFRHNTDLFSRASFRALLTLMRSGSGLSLSCCCFDLSAAVELYELAPVDRGLLEPDAPAAGVFVTSGFVTDDVKDVDSGGLLRSGSFG